MSPQEIFHRVILANELDNSTAHAYKFSDPDGIRAGKSGWSFGVCQFDILNNPRAIDCLRECGFTTDELAGLKAQTIDDMRPMHNKLLANCTVIDRYDDHQLAECLQWPAQLCKQSGIGLDLSGLIALADYHNQFYMSRGGKMHKHLQGIGRPVTADDIYRFKLILPWGQKRPDDVKRRHNNIIAILKQAADGCHNKQQRSSS